MRQKHVLPIIAAIVLTAPTLQSAWGKAHVPLDRVQVCTAANGDSDKDKNAAGAEFLVKNIKVKRLERFLNRGACRLPACDFEQVFMPGDDCSNVSVDDDGDGFCDGAFPKSKPADGITARCTATF